MTAEAIKPKGFIAPDKKAIIAEMERFGAKVERDAKQYPAWRPWTSPVPTKGPRRGGRRTGQLGRGWKRSITTTGDGITLIVANLVSYASYVQGKRQTRVMAGRDWTTIGTVAERHKDEFVKRMAEVGAVKVDK